MARALPRSGRRTNYGQSPAPSSAAPACWGGEGTILGGVLVGAAIMQVLRNGLVLLGFPAYWQSAAIGTAIILALMLDRIRTGRQR